ncbi:MAG TPA: Ig-like domain-containing protein, partial [Bacteroidota bacterium]|nr:Ig-like domain-containing protein [Bacteroidota bacterium]
GQVAPEGGPRDTVPPAVVRTSPDTNATRVRPVSITLEFSKYVDHRSLEESVFISPYLGELKYDWSGKSVTCTYGGELKENTTYVVNVGTDVADMREHTRMASSFVLAFSTGDSIDRGFINGRVFDEKPEGVLIFGYRLPGRLPDTLDPSRVKPDYITQTGKDGTFSLAHLALGAYRVFAVRDEYHNYLYDREIDQYGVASGDFVLSAPHPVVSDLWYRLTKEDTSRPFVSSVKAVDRYRITVRFSEPLDSASFTSSSFTVADTVKGRALPLRLVYRDRFQPSLAGIFMRVPLDSPACYRLTVRGVADLAGNVIDTNARGETFEGTLLPDTLRPLMTFLDLKDSTRDVPLERPIEVRFSDPVVPFSLQAAVTLTDSTHRGVPLLSLWTGPESFALVPAKPLDPKGWFTVRVTMDSVRGLTGKTYRDSSVALHFQTLDLRTMGSIAGSVEDPHGGKGEIFLTASSINTTPVYASTIRMAEPGPFALDRLPEGKYTITAFRDSAGVPAYGFGLPWPFRASDRFTVYRDTIRVRARWGVEGVLVKFR